VLSDGTPLSELIDKDFREVSLRVLTDPELYQLELKHLFAKAWTVVAHEDEVPNVDDYVLRYVGEDQVIVSRAADDTFTVALNVCAHRAAKVCRFEAGNAKTFQCAYHGWVYKSDGTFVGAPIAREDMHGLLRPKSELGLTKGRVETYCGMIFATFDENAPTLREYLGPMTWYWDLMFDRTPGGSGSSSRRTGRAPPSSSRETSSTPCLCTVRCRNCNCSPPRASRRSRPWPESAPVTMAISCGASI
jgi:phenylpropionate dioxygenase-like ring-hydroxylating dioxygenase large terminal subunit